MKKTSLCTVFLFILSGFNASALEFGDIEANYPMYSASDPFAITAYSNAFVVANANIANVSNGLVSANANIASTSNTVVSLQAQITTNNTAIATKITAPTATNIAESVIAPYTNRITMAVVSNSAGRVLIGPVIDKTQYMLQVGGDFRLSNGANGIIQALNYTSSGGQYPTYVTTIQDLYLNPLSGTVYIGSTNASVGRVSVSAGSIIATNLYGNATTATTVTGAQSNTIASALQSESDTLATVTARGATTTNSITAGSFIGNGSGLTNVNASTLAGYDIDAIMAVGSTYFFNTNFISYGAVTGREASLTVPTTGGYLTYAGPVTNGQYLNSYLIPADQMPALISKGTKATFEFYGGHAGTPSQDPTLMGDFYIMNTNGTVVQEFESPVVFIPRGEDYFKLEITFTNDVIKDGYAFLLKTRIIDRDGYTGDFTSYFGKPYYTGFSFPKTTGVFTPQYVFDAHTGATADAHPISAITGLTSALATPLAYTPISTPAGVNAFTASVTTARSIYDFTASAVNTLTNDLSALALNGTTNYQWTARINYTDTNALSTTWDARTEWVGLASSTPDLTVTGRYEFAFSTSDGVTIQGRQVYPSVYEFKKCAFFPTAGTPTPTTWASYSRVLTSAIFTNYTHVQNQINNVDAIVKMSLWATSGNASNNTLNVSIGWSQIFSTVNLSDTERQFITTGNTTATPLTFYCKYYPYTSFSSGRNGATFIVNARKVYNAGDNIDLTEIMSRPANELETRAYNAGWRP